MFIIGIVIYYLIINILAFLMYGSDKKSAKDNTWRIPEATLIGLALWGGGIGSFLGMKFFHHKTRHLKFKIFVPFGAILHICIWILLIIFK
ncbi:DUF1294 domain-containing protein [Thomasclavelia cocleata]|uniref:DUF1294 domain-containing protein n=1 Tax=Thomasclavelia cocleata TaxID=69824 RepID=UPI00256ECF12|nr:DUF1294 domain-containing protein [Thomasclavelia cocleata]